MYTELFAQRVRGGQLSFSIQYDQNEAMPYTVQYAGCGHYFQSLTEAVNYARSRKWITPSQAEKIRRELLQSQGNSDSSIL